MKEMLRRLLICSIAALLLAGPASAGQIVVKLGLVPGKLQVSAAHVSSSSVTLTVADGRGNGHGWTLRASQPVTVVGISAQCAAGSTCTLPALASPPNGRTLLTAAQGTGMGVITVRVSLGGHPDGNLGFTLS